MPTSARPTALLVMCHCETSDRCHWLWQSVSSAPLPKGGWHGEAVTGGFFSRTPCNPSVGAGFYPARGRGRAPPLRTSCSPSVGATLAVARPYNPFRRGRCPHRPEPSFPAPTAGHTGPALQNGCWAAPNIPPHTKTSPLFFPAPCFAPANVL